MPAKSPLRKSRQGLPRRLVPLRLLGRCAASSRARTCLFLFGRTVSIKRRVRCQCVADLSKIRYGTRIATHQCGLVRKLRAEPALPSLLRYQHRKSFITSIFPVAWHEYRCRSSQISVVRSLLWNCDCRRRKRDSSGAARACIADNRR